MKKTGVRKRQAMQSGTRFAKTGGFRSHGNRRFHACWGAAPIPAEHKSCVPERWIYPRGLRILSLSARGGIGTPWAAQYAVCTNSIFAPWQVLPAAQNACGLLRCLSGRGRVHRAGDIQARTPYRSITVLRADMGSPSVKTLLNYTQM